VIFGIHNLEQLAAVLAWIVIGLTAHELAHAAAAMRLGDTSAHSRVSLNPLNHLVWSDLFVFLLAGFMRARPVQVDATQLGDKAPRKVAMIAAAGPAANLVLALALAFISNHLAPSDRATNAIFAQAGLTVNATLAIFNLLPIPPLDGSRIARGLLGRADAFSARLEFNAARWLPVVILADAFTFRFLDLLLTLLIGSATGSLMWITQFP
jgi:Zn-dependent protease